MKKLQKTITTRISQDFQKTFDTKVKKNFEKFLLTIFDKINTTLDNGLQFYLTKLQKQSIPSL